MLETLQIRDFALIDDVEVHFQPGFNALTGETGAGKSIVVNALNLVLGARATSGTVRSGRSEAKIDARFVVNAPRDRLRQLLLEHGLELEEGTLHLTRIVSAQGRSRAYASGALIPISVLAAIGDELVDLHGQHEHQSLLSAERQLELVDTYGNLEKPAGVVAGLVGKLRSAEKALAELEHDDRERMRRVEFQRHEAEEIDQAALTTGEEERLRATRSRMANAEEVRSLRNSAQALLADGEAGALDNLAKALGDLERLAELDAEEKETARRLADIYEETSALAAGLAEGEFSEFDPAELDNVNARLSLLSDLKRKYGDTVDDILAYRKRIAEEIDLFDRRDEHLQDLKREVADLLEKAQSAAEKLSKARRRTVKKLGKDVTAVLRGLGMPAGSFEATLTDGDLTPRGLERAEFLIAANDGEDAQPLKRVASGGEISRVMLAMKAVFADADPVGTLIFDEIDAGIGGAVANQVAETMGALAQSHQVICVTHLAQIAAKANAHCRVTKTAMKGRTRTEVTEVVGENRTEEIARLLDGSLSTESLAHARSLLAADRKASA